MSGTPETDAERWIYSYPEYHETAQKYVSADFARKLERERDEARESLKHITEYGTEEINAAVELRQKLAHALVDLDNMQHQRDFAMKVIKRLEKERDEARAVAGELAHIASKHLSFLLAVTPTKANEPHEKETMKIIAALKRWKKLSSHLMG
jgi:SepF-like predicted cell division protein (DUF552 family)